VNNRRVKFYLITFALLLSANVFASGQSPQPTVQMIVTAEVRHGSNVPPIAQNEVFVYEGHDRDQVTAWIPAQRDHAALELMILLDDGAGISLGSQLDDIRQFVQAQPPSTAIGIAYMQNGMAKVLQNPTSDHAQAAKVLRLPLGMAGIDGSPYLSLTDLISRWPQSSARHEVLMVSDGIDHVYGGGMENPYVDEAVEKAQRAGVIVYAIYCPGVGHYDHSYWRTSYGQMYLSQLSDQTGGESYYIGFTGAPVSFVPYMDDLNRRFGQQYLLTFIPKPQKKAGMQHIKLSTEIPNVELVGAESVYVPASE